MQAGQEMVLVEGVVTVVKQEPSLAVSPNLVAGRAAGR